MCFDKPNYVLVIHVDRYVRDIRRFTAYCTGFDENGFTEPECNSFVKKFGCDIHDKFDDYLCPVTDEYGFNYPCSTWETPGYFSCGYGEVYKDVPENEPIALKNRNLYIKTEIEKYIKNATSWCWEKSDIDRDVKERRSEINEPLSKYPVAMSVAIFFVKEPTCEMIDIVKSRAKEYLDKEGVIISHIEFIEVGVVKKVVVIDDFRQGVDNET